MNPRHKFTFRALLLGLAVAAGGAAFAQPLVITGVRGVDSFVGNNPGTAGVTAGTTTTVILAVTATGVPPSASPVLRWVSGSNVITVLQASLIGSDYRAQLPAALIAQPDSGSGLQMTVPNTTLTSNKFSFPVNPGISVFPANGALPLGTLGRGYTNQLSKGGTAPYQVSLQAGSYPPGLNVQDAPGGIFLVGTPSQSGQFSFTLAITDAWHFSFAAQYTMTVAVSNIVVSDVVMPNGQAGSSYSYQFAAANGAPPYTFRVSSGSLPAGLVLFPNGVVSGTPLGAGTFAFGVTVTDSSRLPASATFSATLTIDPAPVTITTPSPLPAGTVAVSYSVGFLATGGAGGYTYLVDSGTPPPGLTLANGVLSGVPTTAGTYTFVIRTYDAREASATKSFQLVISPVALSITSSAFSDGVVGTAYSATLAASGGVPPYTWGATGLPAGLSLNGAAISGTPTAAGASTVSVTVTDNAGGTASKRLNLNIAAAAPSITTASPLPGATAGAPYSTALAATGGTPPYQWSVVKGATPAGMSLSGAGTLSGTPSAPGTSTFTVQVADAGARTAQADFSITVGTAALTVSTQSLPGGLTGQPYSQAVAAAGGVQPYTWTGTFPVGLSISSGGTISGTTGATGTQAFIVTVTDSRGTTASKSLNVSFSLPALPAATVAGITDTTPAGQQLLPLQLSLANFYPADVTGTVTAAFRADSGGDTGEIQFSSPDPNTNGRVVSFRIPANSTANALPANLGLQVGTVAGTITLTFRYQSGGADVTPIPAPTRTTRVAPAVPVIRTVTATRATGGFNVVVVGYSSTRELTQAVFHFTAASGSTLQTTDLTVPVAALFGPWYLDPASVPTGSQFTYTQPFNVTAGSSTAIASVSVTLTNSQGTSAAASANLQ